ncbi:MAG TPA: TetR/AcrR family transcriptional regulator [bacterium]|nr:TetR/AcrR family transcriptional regulator [bacterium]HPN44976.1 TetR/AcrR family transcriptional regulator [bacterium]
MGIQERREREKEQRKNAILDAAERVFFSKGVTAATMDDVADEAELSKGTLYLYFTSKQELYLGIHHRGFDLMENLFIKAVKNKKTGLEKIKAVGEAYFKFACEYPDHYKAIMYFENTGMDFTEQNFFSDHLKNHGHKVMQFVENLIREGIQDGSINNSLDAEKLAYLLWGQTSGIIQIVMKMSKHPDFGTSFTPPELFKEFMHMTEKIIKAK